MRERPFAHSRDLFADDDGRALLLQPADIEYDRIARGIDTRDRALITQGQQQLHTELAEWLRSRSLANATLTTSKAIDWL